MNIFIYGDSNTWGYIPNLNGYSKNAIAKQYDKESLWWYFLTRNNNVFVNALCGRCICNDNKWLKNRNALKTIKSDTKNLNDIDLTIIMLGTNDCKDMYNLSANQITLNLLKLTKIIEQETKSKIMIVCPPQIVSGTKITSKYYVGGEQKSKELEKYYKNMADQNGYVFVSATNAEIGEDGEHLTILGHKYISKIINQKLINVFNNYCKN